MVFEFLGTLVHSDVFVQYGLIGLFLNGLFSSVIPVPTELTTSALVLAGENLFLIFLALTIGSAIGGFVIYFIGYGGESFFHKIFLKKIHKKHMTNSHGLIEKYGWLIIFFCAWIPVLSDIVPLIAGVRKYSPKKFGIAMSAGKAVKVAAIVFLSSWIIPLVFH